MDAASRSSSPSIILKASGDLCGQLANMQTMRSGALIAGAPGPRRGGWDVIAKAGARCVAQIAIDETWSGSRFRQMK
jgi:hypothetical protein